MVACIAYGDTVSSMQSLLDPAYTCTAVWHGAVVYLKVYLVLTHSRKQILHTRVCVIERQVINR